MEGAMRSRYGLLTAAACTVLLAMAAHATEPVGVESNVQLARGRTTGALKEHIKLGNEWAVTLEDTGQSEFYYQDFAMRPGGRTGWHSHPGLLLITVKEGSVDWYDKDCKKRAF